MPMIDVTTAAGVLVDGAEPTLATELAEALLRAERAPVAEPFTSNTGVFVHVLPEHRVHTAATQAARVVRVQVLTPPGSLDREGQRQLVADATAIVARHSVDPDQAERTWVLLTEAAEGGWGVLGIALGQEEFAALRGRRQSVTADA